MTSIFTGRSAEASLDLTLSVSQSLTKTQMNHLETSDADSAQSKDVWKENLEFLRSSADCLQNPNEPFRDFYLRLTTSDIWWVGGTQPLILVYTTAIVMLP